MKKVTVYLLLLCILLLGFGVRYHNYTLWPREGATFDEFAWTFLGLSLWEKGIPTSWSPHAAYKNRVEYFNPQGARFTLVTPYLEHPPLFGLIAGGFARLTGLRTFDQVTVSRIRPLALIMGVSAIFSVYLLASAVYGNGIGLMASGLYAIIPTVAIGSRLVQNENFFIPLFLIALTFGHNYLKHARRRDLIIASIVSSILPLAKVPWIAAPIALIGMFVYTRKWKAAGWVGMTTILFFSVYVLYGFLLDANVFINLWKLQLSRYDMMFDSIFALFRDPLIVDRTFVDGWIYFGWAAMLLLLTRDIRKNLPIFFGFLSYGAVFAFAIPDEPLHGWYRYPFYPFLVIAIAVFLREHLNKNYLTTACFFVISGLSMLAESWGKVFGFSYPVLRTYLGLVAFGSLGSLFSKERYNKLFQWVNISIFCILILLSAWTILYYNEQ